MQRRHQILLLTSHILSPYVTRRFRLHHLWCIQPALNPCSCVVLHFSKAFTMSYIPFQNQGSGSRSVAGEVQSLEHKKTATPNTSPVLKLLVGLLTLVVTKLPLLYVFSLRMVCRQWNATFCDAHLLKNSFQLVRRKPLFLWRSMRSYKLDVYGLKAGTWKTLDKSFVMKDDRHWYEPGDGWSEEGNGFRVFGEGEDGLLLVEKEVNYETSLHLVNPMTRSSRKLPGTLSEVSGPSIFGMVLDESSNSYKIFSVEYQCYKEQQCRKHGGLDPDLSESSSDDDSDDEADGEYRTLMHVYVYDLKVVSWKKTAEWRGFIQYFDRPVFHHDILYCLTTKYKGNQPYREVHCFDGEKWWHWRKMGVIPPGLLFAHMFKFDGHLMLVGGKGRGFHLSSIHVWTLNEETKKRMESTMMPENLVNGFSLTKGKGHKKFCCHSLEGLTCLIGYSRKAGVQIVMCNLQSNS